MIRKFGVVVSVLLIVGIFVTGLTGQIAVMLDLNRFSYHKWAAYTLICLALVHLCLHFKILNRQIENFRRLGGTGARRAKPAPTQAVPAAARPSTRRAVLAGAAGVLGGVVAGNLYPFEARAQIPEGEDIGQVYHQWSKPTYTGLLRKALSLPLQPGLYKEYPGQPLPLPAWAPPPPGSLEETIERRRSIREYSSRPLTSEELSKLLHYGAGITDRRDGTWPFRSYPSSGALFALELYPVVMNVAGIEPGVYHYNVKEHALDIVKLGNFRGQAHKASWSQDMVKGAAVMFVITSLFDRSRFKYADRAYRYDLLEGGHMGENIYLAGTAMRLGVSGMGAFEDNDVNNLIEVDGTREAALYLLAVGPR